jgi:hypothetical protein
MPEISAENLHIYDQIAGIISLYPIDKQRDIYVLHKDFFKMQRNDEAIEYLMNKFPHLA